MTIDEDGSGGGDGSPMSWRKVDLGDERDEDGSQCVGEREEAGRWFEAIGLMAAVQKLVIQRAVLMGALIWVGATCGFDQGGMAVCAVSWDNQNLETPVVAN
ncbi:hypothetical protein ACLB2K_069047 [Fragaria x ananassa]